MAILAPMLAIARIARAARRGAIEDEFGRWFQSDAAISLDAPSSPSHHVV